ncbi:MAG: hypothetical protein DRI34_05275 [Deltaproteobacteria bacterium]|nr:MAG: hypothetical protein DRI34_05275 [Deltaproteobacteria bacterium]
MMVGRPDKATPASTRQPVLTGALEDYLESIYLLEREHGFARVRDIARARGVKAGSVTPALKRLDEAGLVEYAQREYVKLTDQGNRAARRVLARHDLLKRFFEEVLQMEPGAAEREACAMEHSLSPQGMDGLVRFFEFLSICPEGLRGWLEKFHACAAVQSDGGSCDSSCSCYGDGERRRVPSIRLVDIEPGRAARVLQVDARGAVRQRLLDMGLLPGVEVRVERLAPGGDPIWIGLKGSQLALRSSEASAVMVEG